MKYVIGDKSIFAIEFSINKLKPYAMGHICLWLNNYCLGYMPEEVMLDCSLGSLIELMSDSRQKILTDINISDVNSEQLLDLLMYDQGDLKDATLFNVDESTDDFIIHVYRKEETLFFIWMLNVNPYRKIENYPDGVLWVGVNFDYFKNIVNRFDEKLSFLKIQLAAQFDLERFKP